MSSLWRGGEHGELASRGMNVMMPMGGRGSRFSSDGYLMPKPLIKIAGRPMVFWLLDHLEFLPEDTLWVGIRRSLNFDFAFEAQLREEYPSLDLRLVFLDFQTRGAAETLFVMLQHMKPNELRRKSIALDCDTIYFSNVLGEFRACGSGCGASFYFEDEGEKPIFSYIRFEPGTRRIIDIREKVAISRHANTGAYAFPCGEHLRNACREVLDNPVGKAGEFYTSAIIDGMILKGEEFVGIHVPSFSCVGTPTQLHSFLDLVRIGKVKIRHRTRFCFDLDRTLIVVNSGGMHSAGGGLVEPLERNVRLLQELRYAGHHIIVETFREKLGGEDGSRDVSISGPGGLTLKSLRKLGICYDEIVFGKPVADVYINGRAGNINGDIEKEVGWRLEGSSDEDGKASGGDNFVATRSFNKITRLDERHIVKSGRLEYLRGELHFYRSIPPALSDLFPKLVEANVNPSLEMPSITITKIDGVCYSYLVTNHCVTQGRFLKLLCGLSAIHATRGTSNRGDVLAESAGGLKATEELSTPGEPPTAPAPEPVRRRISPEQSPEDLPSSMLCANLYPKVSSRLKLNKMSYDSFEGVDVPALSQAVLSYLQGYEEEGRCHEADFVHGDPVFSNCLLTKESNVVFVDMRGSLGDTVCTTGDVNYDLSKVYQSLCGYDFIILNKDLDDAAGDMLQDLKETTFWPFVREHYPDTLARDIEVLAASHFLSIVPLHENRRHRERFLSACRDILAANDLLE